MSNTTYGIRKFSPKMWEIGVRDADGAFVLYAHTETRREALASALKGKGKVTITSVVHESDMSADQIAQAQWALFDIEPATIPARARDLDLY